MKSVKEIAEELGVDTSTIRKRIYRLSIKFIKVHNHLHVSEADEKRIKQVKNLKPSKIHIFNQYKRFLLDEFLCFHVIEENNTVNAVNILTSIGADQETAKRIFTTREVVVQSKINFGIV